MGRAHEVRAKAMAATAAQKSKLYAKFAKEVYIAAKQGAPDVNANLTLRKAVEKAKMNQVPADVIKRAIEKDVSFNDIETDEDMVTVYGEFEDLYDIKTAIEETFKDKIKIEQYETAWISNSKVTLEGEEKMLFERLITLLEDDDDVQNVYHNVELA